MEKSGSPKALLTAASILARTGSVAISGKGRNPSWHTSSYVAASKVNCSPVRDTKSSIGISNNTGFLKSIQAPSVSSRFDNNRRSPRVEFSQTANAFSISSFWIRSLNDKGHHMLAKTICDTFKQTSLWVFSLIRSASKILPATGHSCSASRKGRPSLPWASGERKALGSCAIVVIACASCPQKAGNDVGC